MTTSIEIVDRWGTPGAPIRKQEEIRETFEQYFASVAKYGITRQNYLICAREALPHAQRQIMETVLRSRGEEAARCARAAQAAAQEARAAKEAERLHPEDERKAALAHKAARRAEDAQKAAEWAAARHKAAETEEDRPKWSTVISTVRSVLHEFGRVGWTVFWATLRTLEDVFGTRERATWERLRVLREIGWVLVWERWQYPDHEYIEGRSNVYFLRVPEEVWAEWVKRPDAQRLMAKLSKGELSADALDVDPGPAAATTPSGPASIRPQSASIRPAPPASTRSRATSGPTSTRPATAWWFPAIFQGERAGKYRGEPDPDTATDAAIEQIERHLQAAASTAYNTRKKDGVEPPPLEEVRRVITVAAVQRYLADRGGNDFLLKNRHSIRYFVQDVPSLAVACGDAWVAAQPKVAPPSLPSLPTVKTSARESLAAAADMKLDGAIAPIGAVLGVSPPPPRYQRMDAAAHAKLLEQRSAAPASVPAQPAVAAPSSVQRVDPDGELDTLVSAPERPPDRD